LPLQISSIATAVVVIGVILAAVIDLRTRRIPNELTAAMTGIGFGLGASAQSDVSMLASLAGFTLGLMFMMPGYVMGATGAGDVKLMGAIGALVGPAMVLTAFLCTSIAGGVLALIVAVQRQRLTQTIAATGRLIAAPVNAPTEIKGAAAASRFAYGPAIAVGSLVAVLIA
jgi:prepilin peptidase CpaA